MTDNRLGESTSADSEFEGSSEEAPLQAEEYSKPEERSEDIDSEASDDVEDPGFSEMFADLQDPWTATLGRCASLVDRQNIVNKGRALKERRSAEADSGQYQTIDPRKVKTHSRFKRLLEINLDLEESISAAMAVEGFRPSQAIVLGTWPGLEEPVLIDGHTRVKAAIRAGVKKIYYSIERFDDIDGALEYAATAQAQRRTTDDWVRLQLLRELDSLYDRGGDRRSEAAKSKGPVGPNETNYKNSAERTGSLVGWSARKVKRGRRIIREATPDILEALKNRKMTIAGAEKAIIKKAKPEADNKTDSKDIETRREPVMVALTEENVAALRELGKTLHFHVNAAVAEYIERLGEAAGLTEERDQDDQVPESLQSDE